MNAPLKRKIKVATTSLAGCFGCHMSFLDLDERLFALFELIEFDRSPFTDIKRSATATSASSRAGCAMPRTSSAAGVPRPLRMLVAIGACAINGGLPAQRNHLRLPLILQEVYQPSPGSPTGSFRTIPSCRCRSTRCTRCTKSSRSTTSSRGARRRRTRSGRRWPTSSPGQAELGHGLIHYD